MSVPPEVRLTRDPDRADRLADTFGQAFVEEPMMRSPLGTGKADAAECFTRCGGPHVWFMRLDPQPLSAEVLGVGSFGHVRK